MSIKVQYSNSYWAKRKRIQRLPKMGTNALYGLTKRDIVEINIIFHDGIKDNKLSLDKLADITLRSKVRKGYEKPDSPLYGAGDSEGDRSYSNMMIIKKVSNGWKLEPSNKLHHSRKIKLKDLFTIHEHGAIVKMKTKDGEKLIRIPPRPALLMSYQKWLLERSKRETRRGKEVKKAIAGFVNEGDDKKFKIWSDFNTRLNEKTRELEE